jgi:hypothetical protein
MIRKVADMLGTDVISVWKIAITLVGWIIMGVWMSARITTGFEYLRADVNNIRADVRILSQRLDKRIDDSITYTKDTNNTKGK